LEFLKQVLTGKVNIQHLKLLLEKRKRSPKGLFQSTREGTETSKYLQENNPTAPKINRIPG